jgi:hypothetical protein
MDKQNIVKTVEELEQFINTHSDCEVYGTKELDDKLNRAMQFTLDKTSEEIDLSFKAYKMIDVMCEKGIKYKAVRNGY